MTPFIIRFDDDIHQKMKVIAAYHKKSLNALMIDMFRQKVSDWEQEHGKSVPGEILIYSEAKHLSGQLGFAESSKGKTSGSRVNFYRVLDGRIDGIRDLVTFESETVSGIIQEFHSAVNEYLLFCEENGKEALQA